MDFDVVEVIQGFYHDANICAHLDWEMTLAGNGTNPGEAKNAYRALLIELDAAIPPPPTATEIRDYIVQYGEDPSQYGY